MKGDTLLLASLSALLARMRATTSSKHKLCILRDAPKDAREFLIDYLQLGPLYMGKASLERFKPEANRTSLDLNSLLAQLANRSLSGHHAASAVHEYISRYPDHRQLIMSLLERDLEVRMSPEAMKKALFSDSFMWPGVALAEAFDAEVFAKASDWWASRKLDGVRCLAHKTDIVQFYSRTKLPLNGPHLQPIKEAMFKSLPPGCWLDGELCWIPAGGNLDDLKESFKETIQRVRSGQEKPGEGSLHFLAFDRLDQPELAFSKRLEALHSLTLLPPLQVLPQTKVTNNDELSHLWKLAQERGWEGLMIRRDLPHRPTRSTELLKLKAWQDAEYPVVDYILTRMRCVQEGREQWEEGLLGALVIQHGGNLVQVGSGFTLAERRELAKLGDALIGRLITVAYFGETDCSLRFPIFKAIHEHGHRLL